MALAILALVAAMVPAEQRVLFTLVAYAAVAVTVMIFAHLWLRRLSRGPLELAWAWCCRAITARLGDRESPAAVERDPSRAG